MKVPELRRFALKDLPPEPWKNGGGTTRTVMQRQSDASGASPDWRVSIAEIADSGLFSVFPGVERTAVVLENGPLRLSKTPVPSQVAAPLFLAMDHVPLVFDGETELFADLAGQPVLCLNVMTRRAAATAQVEVCDADASIEPSTETILFATAPGWRIDTGNGQSERPFDRYEGAVIEAAGRIRIRAPAGGGRLIAIRIMKR